MTCNHDIAPEESGNKPEQAILIVGGSLTAAMTEEITRHLAERDMHAQILIADDSNPYDLAVVPIEHHIDAIPSLERPVDLRERIIKRHSMAELVGKALLREETLTDPRDSYLQRNRAPTSPRRNRR